MLVLLLVEKGYWYRSLYTRSRHLRRAQGGRGGGNVHEWGEGSARYGVGI